MNREQLLFRRRFLCIQVLLSAPRISPAPHGSSPFRSAAPERVLAWPALGRAREDQEGPRCSRLPLVLSSWTTVSGVPGWGRGRSWTPAPTQYDYAMAIFHQNGLLRRKASAKRIQTTCLLSTVKAPCALLPACPAIAQKMTHIAHREAKSEGDGEPRALAAWARAAAPSDSLRRGSRGSPAAALGQLRPCLGSPLLGCQAAPPRGLAPGGLCGAEGWCLLHVPHCAARSRLANALSDTSKDTKRVALLSTALHSPWGPRGPRH